MYHSALRTWQLALLLTKAIGKRNKKEILEGDTEEETNKEGGEGDFMMQTHFRKSRMRGCSEKQVASYTF